MTHETTHTTHDTRLMTYLTDPVYPGLFYKKARHLLIHSLIESSFSSQSSGHHKSQTNRARKLNFFENVHFFGQSVGASRWRVCYQRGLPRLVSITTVLCFSVAVRTQAVPSATLC